MRHSGLELWWMAYHDGRGIRFREEWNASHSGTFGSFSRNPMWILYSWNGHADEQVKVKNPYRFFSYWRSSVDLQSFSTPEYTIFLIKSMKKKYFAWNCIKKIQLVIFNNTFKPWLHIQSFLQEFWIFYIKVSSTFSENFSFLWILTEAMKATLSKKDERANDLLGACMLNAISFTIYYFKIAWNLSHRRAKREKRHQKVGLYGAIKWSRFFFLAVFYLLFISVEIGNWKKMYSTSCTICPYTFSVCMKRILMQPLKRLSTYLMETCADVRDTGPFMMPSSHLLSTLRRNWKKLWPILKKLVGVRENSIQSVHALDRIAEESRPAKLQTDWLLNSR